MLEDFTKFRRLISNDQDNREKPTPARGRGEPPLGDAMPRDGSGSGPESAAILRHYLRVLQRRARVIVAVAVTTMIVTYGALQVLPDTYEVKASLLVKLGRENTEVQGAIASGNVVSSGVRKEEINSEVTLLTAEALIAQSVDKAGVDRFFPEPAEPVTIVDRIRAFGRGLVKTVRAGLEELAIGLNLAPRLTRREKAILAVQRNLLVKRDGESDVILVTLRLPDKKLAADVVNNLIDLFLSRRVEARRDVRVQGVFDERVALFKHRLDILDAERNETRLRTNLSGVKQEREFLLRRREEVNDLVAVARRDLALLKPGASEPMTEDTPKGLAHTSVLAIKTKIADLLVERTRLMQQSTGSKRMVALDREIAQLRALALATLEAAIAKLSREVQEIDARIQQINKGEDDLERLQQDFALAQSHYVNYMKRAEEARIHEELNLRRVANIAVLSWPTNPAEPVAPRRLMIMLASVPIGLLLGLSLAIFLDHIDGRVRDPREIEQAGLACLGTFVYRGDALARVRRPNRTNAQQAA